MAGSAALLANVDLGDGAGPIYLAPADMAALSKACVGSWRVIPENPDIPRPILLQSGPHVKLGLYFDFTAHGLGKEPFAFIGEVCAAIRSCLHSHFDQKPLPHRYVAAFNSTDMRRWCFWFPGVLWSSECATQAQHFVASRVGGLVVDAPQYLPFGGTYHPYGSDNDDVTLFHIGSQTGSVISQASINKCTHQQQIPQTFEDLLCAITGQADVNNAPLLVKGAAKCFSAAFGSFVDRRLHATHLTERRALVNAATARRQEAIHGPEGAKCSCGAAADHRSGCWPPINMLAHCGIADSMRGLATLKRECAKIVELCDGDYDRYLWPLFNTFFAFCNGCIYYRAFEPQFGREAIVRISEAIFRSSFKGVKLVVKIADQPDKEPKAVFRELAAVWLDDSGASTLRPQRNSINAVYLHPLPIPRGPFASASRPAYLVSNNTYLNTWQGFAIKQLLGDAETFKRVAACFADPDPHRWTCSDRVFEWHYRLYQLMGFNDEVYLALVHYIGSLLTYPNVVHQKGFVIVGPEGVWKSTYAASILRLFGAHGHKSTNLDSLLGQFVDPALRQAIMLLWDDAKPSRDGAGLLPATYNLLTGTTVTSELKYSDKETIANPTRGLIVCANPKEGDYAGNFLNSNVTFTDDMGRRLVWPDWRGPPDGIGADRKYELKRDLAWLCNLVETGDTTLETWELENAFLLIWGFDSTAWLSQRASRDPPNTLTRMTVVRQKQPPFVNFLLQCLARGSQVPMAPPKDPIPCKRLEDEYKTGGSINPQELIAEQWWAVHRGLAGGHADKGWMRTVTHPQLCWAIRASNLFDNNRRNYSMTEIMAFFERNMPGCVKQTVVNDLNASIVHPDGAHRDPIKLIDIFGGAYYTFEAFDTCKAAFELVHHSTTTTGLADEARLNAISLRSNPSQWLDLWDDAVANCKAKFKAGFVNPFDGVTPIGKIDFAAHANRCYFKAYAESPMARWMKSATACFDDDSQLFLSRAQLADLILADNADVIVHTTTKRARSNSMDNMRVEPAEDSSDSYEPIARPHTTAPDLYIDPLRYVVPTHYADPILNMLPPTPIVNTDSLSASERAALDKALYGGPPDSPPHDAHAEQLKAMSDEEAAEQEQQAAAEPGEEQYGAEEASDESVRKRLKRNPFVLDEAASEDEGDDPMFDDLAPLSQGDIDRGLRINSPGSSEEDPILTDLPVPSL